MDAHDSSIGPDRIRFYTAPAVVRLLVALSGGGQRAHHLAAVTGCRWDETEEALRGLQHRGMISREAGGYRLTQSGHVLAGRLLSCASGLYRALYSRPGFSLPPLPLVVEGVLDDIGHLSVPSYQDAFRHPECAEGEMREWMLSRGYLSDADGALRLTPRGEAYLTFLDRCSRTIATIEQFNSFFESHSLDDIPEFAVQRIGDLMGGVHFMYLPANLEEGLENFLEILKEAGSIHGVSTWSLPFVAEAIWKRVTAGAEVELVITPDLAGPLWQEEFVGRERDVADVPNFRLFVSTVPITVGLTVTDRALSLGLCREDGTYDTVHDLVSRAPEALAWGERLFEYYKDHAVPIEDFFREREKTT
ncbi:helix-turn-helix transcriptional regulator [Methanofollis ethanolicus]|uniref:helix-turn-helix transcriptional regulator n=1 Tax=Methanofollis ethanolicus TaxID=488124 RepID=UPI000837757D|nr:transcriptional regulator FilR1 domain-containing protein [Methanofollis ethanolicus]